MNNLEFYEARFYFNNGRVMIIFTDYSPGEKQWEKYYTWALEIDGRHVEKMHGVYFPDGIHTTHAMLLALHYIKINNISL
jgi:hypothetical protein